MDDDSPLESPRCCDADDERVPDGSPRAHGKGMRVIPEYAATRGLREKAGKFSDSFVLHGFAVKQGGTANTFRP